MKRRSPIEALVLSRNRLLLCVALLGVSVTASAYHKARDLRLVPFPKQVRLSSGFARPEAWTKIEVTDGPVARQAALDLRRELARTSRSACDVSAFPAGGEWLLVVSAGDADPRAARKTLGRLPAQSESYKLIVTHAFAAIGAGSERGLAHGIQTLRQLIRANMEDGGLGCLTITDYPSLKYRGFQNDITRGPSPRLGSLERQVEMGAFLRMNFFTYYLEHQFGFRKHPKIGPSNGSLQPAELAALVRHAKDYGTEVFGCQQSFGHFHHILKHQEYSALRETAHILDPTNEDSYKLLDDMYSEQVPLLESDFFNVCCDETFGLGTGPSKALAEKIGVGGVYARHIARIHQILREKYGKRIMVWGDIILQHPENLAEIPKDTVMLSWGYDAAGTYEPCISPFKKAGFDFFVCPGTSCWSRILPDFRNAVMNIQGYVRDGAKLGAMGMLNTTWLDDGETLWPQNWHGIAWGAECAWNGSTTTIEDFNRRVGAVLFGEKGDHFGRAIDLLSKAHRLAGYDGMTDSRFWEDDFGKSPADKTAVRQQAKALLAIADPAIKHLRAAKADAVVNADILDCFIYGAERMRFLATRRLDFLAAAEARASSNTKAQAMLAKIRSEHFRLKDRYIELWNRENKPYALDWVTSRFDSYKLPDQAL